MAKKKSATSTSAKPKFFDKQPLKDGRPDPNYKECKQCRKWCFKTYTECPKCEANVRLTEGKAKAKKAKSGGDAKDYENIANEYIVLSRTTVDDVLKAVKAYTDPVIPPIGLFIQSLGGQTKAISQLEALKERADNLNSQLK